jgi:hypothetical protein
MAKYLSKPCVDIRIKTLQVSRKQSEPEGSGDWQTYVVLIGEAIDEDGKTLESIHKKFDVGSPGPDDWDGDSFAADLATIAGVVKSKYDNVKANFTTP